VFPAFAQSAPSPPAAVAAVETNASLSATPPAADVACASASVGEQQQEIAAEDTDWLAGWAREAQLGGTRWGDKASRGAQAGSSQQNS